MGNDAIEIRIIVAVIKDIVWLYIWQIGHATNPDKGSVNMVYGSYRVLITYFPDRKAVGV